MKRALVIIVCVLSIWSAVLPAPPVSHRLMPSTDTVFRDENGNIRVTELEEVVVKRKKYSKKGNPAVDLIQQIRNQHHRSDPRKEQYYSYNAFDHITFGLNNYTRKDNGLEQFIDTIPETGTPVLQLSVKDKSSRRLFRNSPESDKSIVRAYRSDGVDRIFDSDNVKKVLEDALRQIDIYDNDLTLLQNRFVSPLSAIAPDFYKFYLSDTVTMDGDKYVKVLFAPHNRQSMGFVGEMYVLTDSTKFVRKVKMHTPDGINLNYVKSLWLEQEYCQDSKGNRHKTADKMTVVIQILPGTPEINVRRQTIYDDFNYSYISSLREYYEMEGYEHWLPGAGGFSEEELLAMRPAGISGGNNVSGLLKRFESGKLYYWGSRLLAILVRGYITTGNPSKFDIGPVNTFISSNDVEGLRLRIGGMTTANLSKRLFARAHIAYGCKDGKFKYGAEAEYSFIDKTYHSYEFPINSLRLKYNRDIDQIGQHYLFTNADNVFLSLKRMKNDRVTYRDHASITYTYERKNGFSLEGGLKWEKQSPSRWLPFIKSDGKVIPHYYQSAFFVSLRYAPGETFYQSASARLPINMDTPILQLTQEYAPAGFLGSNFEYNKTEFSVQKRFWLSAFGYVDGVVRAAKIWSSVYYPALTWANANLSYTIQRESFDLMRPMEFATDQYLSWDFTYWMNGLIFNRIPLIKKLRLREVVAFRGYYGSLTRKNNPEDNPRLPVFPEDAHVGLMGRSPYMEMSAGIDNILTILRVDWVWRLTYRNCPDKDRYGLRIALHFSF